MLTNRQNQPLQNKYSLMSTEQAHTHNMDIILKVPTDSIPTPVVFPKTYYPTTRQDDAQASCYL